jgi:excisionase family DNA binding protein
MISGADVTSEQPAGQVLLTIPQAEVALNWGRTSIYKAVGAGKIRAVWLGRSIRIPQSEIVRIATEGLPE